MARVSEKALLVALVCIVLLGFALAAEHAIQEGEKLSLPPQFGPLHSRPSRRPPHYKYSPSKRPLLERLSSPFGSFHLGPYINYEEPPPSLKRPLSECLNSPYGLSRSGPGEGGPGHPHHEKSSSPFGSIHSGPYINYEEPPPSLKRPLSERLNSPYGLSRSGPGEGGPGHPHHEKSSSPFGSIHLGPYLNYEEPPPSPKRPLSERLNSPYGLSRSGPDEGGPGHPHHGKSFSPFGSFHSGPYLNYEEPPPSPKRPLSERLNSPHFANIQRSYRSL